MILLIFYCHALPSFFVATLARKARVSVSSEITKSNERSIVDAMHEINSERKMVHFGMTQFILLKKSYVTLLMLRKQKRMAE